MRILHVITNLNTGGAEKLLVELLPLLHGQEAEVELALFVGQRTPFLGLLEAAGIRMHLFSMGGNVYNPINIIKLIRLSRQYDLVHTHNTAPQLYGAIASLFCDAKFCTTEHTTTNHHRVWWFKPIEKWMYSRYERIICISDGVKESLIDCFGNKQTPKLTIIPNGINIKIFQDAVAINRNLISNNPQRRVISMVGRCSYQKDQETVIRALSRLSDDYELWLVGDGETINRLKELAFDLGLKNRVIFLGSRSDVPTIMKATDIIVQSSHIEGFGLAAVEGMASGKPVIASDIPGLRKVVEGAGVLFAHQDAEGLASIIERVMNDSQEYQQLVERGRERAGEYDIRNMATGYLKVYSDLLS